MEANAQGMGMGGGETGGARGGTLDGAMETAQNTAQNVMNKSGEALSSLRDKAGEIPARIADGLEAGANALRHDRHTPAMAGVGMTGAMAEDGSTMGQVSDRVATGLQSGADWLRDADLNKLKSSLEEQVREKPARTLLIALGVGYLLGKAIRR